MKNKSRKKCFFIPFHLLKSKEKSAWEFHILKKKERSDTFHILKKVCIRKYGVDVKTYVIVGEENLPYILAL